MIGQFMAILETAFLGWYRCCRPSATTLQQRTQKAAPRDLIIAKGRNLANLVLSPPGPNLLTIPQT